MGPYKTKYIASMLIWNATKIFTEPLDYNNSRDGIK